MELLFFTDPIENFYGPLKPPLLIARKLKRHFDITIVSPFISEKFVSMLKHEGYGVINLNKKYPFSGSLLTFFEWLSLTKLNPQKHRNTAIVNFSQCFLVDANIYYAQGPITKALDDISPEMNFNFRVSYMFARPFLVAYDKWFNRRLRERSGFIIANSSFCRRMYEEWGIKIDGLIYPPLDCGLFRPTTSKPSDDYILTYIGKETKYSVIKKIAHSGIKIKAFGAKNPFIPKNMLKHPNIEFWGKVTDSELVNLYSNALYTLFIFTHEPFGYIPVESMACGTPILTYGKQGPSETIINNVTGWLVNDDKKLIDYAKKIWRNGYPSDTRLKCRERSLKFNVELISCKWLEILLSLINE
ncbi:glycosyltransferase [Candidatus Bathyarchaeota archaeon]|nr:glycosyltransferase [Candidatus Bathyarchaeota archaeon]